LQNKKPPGKLEIFNAKLGYKGSSSETFIREGRNLALELQYKVSYFYRVTVRGVKITVFRMETGNHTASESGVSKVIQEIFPDLYRIEVPLPGNPLKVLNSYVVKSKDRNLVIDTGMNREECLRAMQYGLDKLRIDLTETDFFITHLHADHSGLVARLASGTSVIYGGHPDALFLMGDFRWEDAVEFARKCGFSESEVRQALEMHPGKMFSHQGNIDIKVLEDGETLSVGKYRFFCVKTPGHTEGHLCLYEPDKKFFIAGDHILGKITPNISLWIDDQENLLEQYLNSLDKVIDFDIDLVLPGHRGLVTDCRKRIDELKVHHQKRNEEILKILQRGGQNAYQIASRMRWDLSYASWEQFPIPQKWFATGEVNAHLKYLETAGRVKRRVLEQEIIYELTT